MYLIDTSASELIHSLPSSSEYTPMDVVSSTYTISPLELRSSLIGILTLQRTTNDNMQIVCYTNVG